MLANLNISELDNKIMSNCIKLLDINLIGYSAA